VTFCVFSCNNYRLDIELRKKVCKQTYYSINKLVNIAVGRDVSKLEKNMDFLRAKLHDVKTVLGKGEINESSRCWSEMLSETKAFMGFVLQSFRDISKHINAHDMTTRDKKNNDVH